MRLFVEARYSGKSGGPEKNKYHTEQNTLSQIEAIESKKERERQSKREGEKAF